MSKLYFSAFTLVLIVVELLYFSIAQYFQIIDKPNERSLHEKPTIRGGGIIFPISLVLFLVTGEDVSYYFLAAISLLAVAGFLDDIRGLGRLTRFGIQVIAMLLVFYDLHVFAHSWWIILLLLVITTGTVNAYNFMDGINGITSGYSFVVLASLYYINNHVIWFVNNDLLLTMMLALGVFSFFNFRIKAICFAGDVGSLTIGFAMIYLIMKLVLLSHNYVFVLFLGVYGTDSVLTITHRLILRQNIFKAHKLHLYQTIVSATKMPHLLMTGIYMIVQMIVSILIIANLRLSQPQQYILGATILVVLCVAYLGLKRHFYKSLRNVV